MWERKKARECLALGTEESVSWKSRPWAAHGQQRGGHGPGLFRTRCVESGRQEGVSSLPACFPGAAPAVMSACPVILPVHFATSMKHLLLYTFYLSDFLKIKKAYNFVSQGR